MSPFLETGWGFETVSRARGVGWGWSSVLHRLRLVGKRPDSFLLASSLPGHLPS